jgi:uncharacterized protein (DUF302 family)
VAHQNGPEPDSLIVKISPWSVTDTLTRLLGILDARGLKTFAVIDHSGGARDVGLALPDTKVVMFGNAQAGTPVMEAAPLAALDLPLKILLWDDGERTQVCYTNPAALARRYGFSEELAQRLGGIHTVTDVLIEG